MRAQNHAFALTQAIHSEHLATLIEQGAQIIKLLTPEKGDGPTLEELLGHIVGQLTELTDFARQQIKTLSAMEQTLPGDVASAVVAAAGKSVSRNGGDPGPGQGNRA